MFTFSSHLSTDFFLINKFLRSIKKRTVLMIFYSCTYNRSAFISKYLESSTKPIIHIISFLKKGNNVYSLCSRLARNNFIFCDLSYSQKITRVIIFFFLLYNYLILNGTSFTFFSLVAESQDSLRRNCHFKQLLDCLDSLISKYTTYMMLVSQ